jgi:hypothetical protein
MAEFTMVKQIELFASAELQPPSPPKPPRPAPVPARVRRHMEEMLAELPWRRVASWEDWRLKSQSELFSGLANLLPDEAAEWRARWDAEIARQQQAV